MGDQLQRYFDETAAKLAAASRTSELEHPERARVAESLEREADEAQRAGAVGYFCRLLAQATMPHSKPDPGVHEFKRTNGMVTVKLIADSDYGLPYGTYPRLLLAWVTTEAVRTKSAELELGDSLRAFMAKLDLATTGGEKGTIRPLRTHMQRLFSAHVSASYQVKGAWKHVGFSPVEEAILFWDPKNPAQGALWQSTIRLNQRFYEEIVRHPVPVDLDALRTLAKSRSSLAIDVYMWLTHRMSYLGEPTTIPWATLQTQFGGDYGRTRDFKAKFLERLRDVVAVYPQARLETLDEGLRLLPSRPHVPMRLVKGRR